MTNSGTLLPAASPVDGRELPAVSAASPAQVEAAIERARAAQPAWAALTTDDRAEVLKAVRERFLADAERLVALMTDELGKPAGEGWTSEILPNARLFDFWVGKGPGLLAPKKVSINPLDYPGKRGYVESVPQGVVGLVSPWNLPVAIPLRTLVPALLAGNAVVWKPSEWTPRVSAALYEHFAAELNEGVLELVQGAGDVGAAVVEAADMVVFTGSVATGRKVAEVGARRLIPTSLELGGKDAAIVLADADLERTAQGLVWGAFYNAGQNCASVERVYVERNVARSLEERIVAITRSLTPGQVGPQANEKQREIIRAQVSAAIDAGAEAVAGGPKADTDENGYHYPPTVLRGVPEDAAVMTEETFGPVLPLVVVDNADEAVAKANDSAYGLTASVWTRDIARGEALAKRLDAGVVTVNNHSFTGSMANAPWSGTKLSGHGVTNSEHALRELTRPRFVLVDKSKGARELWWYPYNEALLQVARSMTTLMRKKATGKLAAIKALLRGFLSRFK